MNRGMIVLPFAAVRKHQNQTAGPLSAELPARPTPLTMMRIISKTPLEQHNARAGRRIFGEDDIAVLSYRAGCDVNVPLRI